MSQNRQMSLLGVVAFSIAVAVAMQVHAAEPGAGPASWADDLTPIAAEDWSYDRAAHLLERAGFGGTPEEIERLAALGPKGAVDALLNYEQIDNSALPPFDESGIWDEDMLADINENFDFGQGIAKARRTGSAYGAVPNESGVRPFQPIINMLYYRNYSTRHEWDRAIVWWANRMLNSPRSLEEKMTLFWHGHFATEQEKVRDYRLLLDQIEMLRENATGNFRDLLLGIAQDPAMLVYLDNRKNVKGHANENFAREIMELFALGVGNYTEDDVKEAARAFTGWANYGRDYSENADLHDQGEKTVLGETGNFNGQDIIGILLRQEACAEFISRKIYRFLVREDLSPELNRELAAVLRDGGYDLKPLLRTIFRSRDFYSHPSYASQIKSPVQFLISSYKKLDLAEVPGTPNFYYVASQLGQALGNPPNVKGWDGGRSWINPSTLIERGNIMRHVLFPEEAEGQYDLGPFAGRYQRYVNAHMEVLQRDREGIIGTAAPAVGQEKMESGEGMMMAPSANMINETPQYDLPYGVFNGKSKAFERVKAPNQAPAQFSLSSMLRAEGIATVGEAVAYLEKRFLRLPLSKAVRDAIRTTIESNYGGAAIDFDSPATERALRETLHLIMSSPEFQLS